MTREEELDWLRRLRSEIYLYMPIEWLIPMDKALDMVIKELEQEPTIDKIRAEILEKCFDVPYENQAFDYGLKIVKWSDVREIIDKYKTESENP